MCDERALFDQWETEDGEVPANRRACYHKIWMAALQAPRGAQNSGVDFAAVATARQEELFAAWFDTPALQRGYSLDDFFNVWLSALAANGIKET